MSLSNSFDCFSVIFSIWLCLTLLSGTFVDVFWFEFSEQDLFCANMFIGVDWGGATGDTPQLLRNVHAFISVYLIFPQNLGLPSNTFDKSTPVNMLLWNDKLTSFWLQMRKENLSNFELVIINSTDDMEVSVDQYLLQFQSDQSYKWSFS